MGNPGFICPGKQLNTYMKLLYLEPVCIIEYPNCW